MNKMKMFGICAAFTGIMSLVCAGVVTNAEMTTENDFTKTILGSTEVSTGEELSTKEVVQNSMPAMVSITNTSVQNVRDYFGGNNDLFNDFFFGDFFGYGYGNGYGNGGDQYRESVSRGSGVIVGETDDSFLIATNAHVVADATELTVSFIDDTAVSAETVGADSVNDVALIKVAKSELSDETKDMVSVIALGSSDELCVGEEVIAIGNALGYGQSASRGIVSALGRSISTYNESTGAVEQNENLIQTDAAINPGNSGGALLNMKGELIGINVAKSARYDSEGMGYAIPIDIAEPILSDIANGRQPETGNTESSSIEAGSGNAFLGITCVTITQDYADAYGIPTGAYVNSIEPGSAAEKAGIREGDIITAVDGSEVSSATDLKNLISHYSEGDSADLTVVCFSMNQGGGNGAHNYSTTTVHVTFGTQAVDEAA